MSIFCKIERICFVCIALLFCCLISCGNSDDHLRNRKVIVITGSSTIKRWTSFPSVFPGKEIVNTGKGGTHMQHVMENIEDGVLKYQPSVVFIYSGDNDLGHGKTPKEILESAIKIVDHVEQRLDSIRIIFITAKPSPYRWHLKESFVKYNEGLKKLAEPRQNVFIMDIWDAMLNESDEPDEDLFIEDGLHLNHRGYELWNRKAIEVLSIEE